jgi:hypothetical protein
MVTITTDGVLVAVGLELGVLVAVAVSVAVADGAGVGEEVGVGEDGTPTVGVIVAAGVAVPDPIVVGVAVESPRGSPSSPPPQPTCKRRQVAMMNSPARPFDRIIRAPFRGLSMLDSSPLDRHMNTH